MQFAASIHVIRGNAASKSLNVSLVTSFRGEVGFPLKEIVSTEGPATVPDRVKRVARFADKKYGLTDK